MADLLRRGGKRSGAEIGGRILGPADFYKKLLVYLSARNRRKKLAETLAEKIFDYFEFKTDMKGATRHPRGRSPQTGRGVEFVSFLNKTAELF